MEILTLSAAEVRRLLDPDALVVALAEAFGALSNGDVDAPDRIGVSVPGAGSLLVMPGYQRGREIGVKLVSLFHDNARRGLPTHQALITLFDAETGSPVALMDGTAITALRTAGASALSAQLLARQDARVLTIIGGGVQASSHLNLLPRVREFSEIRVVARDASQAERLAAEDVRARVVASVEEGVRGADVVCLCTSASESMIQAEWVAPGTHVTSVGYAPLGGELPRGLIERGRLFVETRRAFEAPPAGCAELAGMEPRLGTELGEVVLGSAPGRQSDEEITVYKSMGHASEDLAAASLVYRRAKEEGVGRVVEL